MTQVLQKTTPISFDKISKVLEKHSIGNRDLPVFGRDMEFTKNKSLRIKGGGSVKPIEYKLDDWSFGQMCTKLGMPRNYIDKCPMEGAGGIKAQVDHWMATIADKEILLRVKNAPESKKAMGTQGYVRAMLTQSYSAIDNLPFWRLFRPYLEKNGYIVQRANVTEQSFHIRALIPEGITLPSRYDPNGVHHFGIHTANSEVGARYLTGDFLLYREICTNGLIAKFHDESMFKQKHHKTDTATIRQSIVSGLEGVGHHKAEMIDAIKEAKTISLKDPIGMIERILKRERVANPVIEMSLASYNREPDPTKFGVVQAFTAAARSLDADERMKLESVAGSFLLRPMRKQT